MTIQTTGWCGRAAGDLRVGPPYCFFHVAPAPDGSVLLVVGDVSGKGLSAAMSVSVIIGALRSNPMREPSQVLTQLNQAVYGFISGFATCCVALLTPEGQLRDRRAPQHHGATLFSF